MASEWYVCGWGLVCGWLFGVRERCCVLVGVVVKCGVHPSGSPCGVVGFVVVWRGVVCGV